MIPISSYDSLKNIPVLWRIRKTRSICISLLCINAIFPIFLCGSVNFYYIISFADIISRGVESMYDSLIYDMIFIPPPQSLGLDSLLGFIDLFMKVLKLKDQYSDSPVGYSKSCNGFCLENLV